jgi:glycosyltransferase involved in cell wall biosynthesis
MSNLERFPQSPLAYLGWPWEINDGNERRPMGLFDEFRLEDGPALVARVKLRSRMPRISVITPSFNQGQYIEETMRSVLLQGYPNLEYIVIDGGSTDGSVAIIERYARWLHYWVSEKDRGQSHAINKGFQIATGDIIAYLNSDDIYLPDALWRVADAWQKSPKCVVFVGGFVHVYESRNKLSAVKRPLLPHRGPIDLSLLNHESWRLPQQSGFFSGNALKKGQLFVYEDLHYTMDRELYCRLLKFGKACFIDNVLATYRLHEVSKTCSSVMQMYREDSKAISKAKTGLLFDDFRRVLVGRGWLARGYWKRANQEDVDRFTRFVSLLGSGANYPRYMGRKQFWRLIAGCFGLDSTLVKKKIVKLFRFR